MSVTMPVLEAAASCSTIALQYNLTEAPFDIFGTWKRYFQFFFCISYVVGRHVHSVDKF